MENKYYYNSIKHINGHEIIGVYHKKMHQTSIIYTKNNLISFLQTKLYLIDEIVYGNKNRYDYNYKDGFKCFSNNIMHYIITVTPDLMYDLIFSINFLKLNKIIFFNDPYVASFDNIYDLLLKNEKLNIEF